MWLNEDKASIRQSFGGNETSVKGRPDIRSMCRNRSLCETTEKRSVKLCQDTGPRTCEELLTTKRES